MLLVNKNKVICLLKHLQIYWKLLYVQICA